MPTDWSDQLRAAYPKRSGPCGWAGMKLMMAVRRALNATHWETIMEGVKGYARYCEQSGKVGSEFVKTPQAFFDEGIYLEELSFQEPEDPRIADKRVRDAAIRSDTERKALALGLQLDRNESTAALKTRISLTESRGNSGERRVDGSNGANPLSGRIADLANRLRVAK